MVIGKSLSQAWGGVGKTQVVLELAYRIRQKDEGCSVFWIPCTSPAVIEQTFLEIGQTIGLEDLDPAQVKEQLKTHFSSDRAGRWLLIFDNADDPDIWLSPNEVGLRLRDYLPQNEQGRVLFTTRNRKLGVDLSERNIFPVPDVDKETALSMLQELAMQIPFLEQLAFLPLAIAQASAYIAKNGLDLSEYLELLQEQESEMVELLSEDFTDQGRYKEIQNSVATTWLISFKRIQHENQLAADTLFFMACCNPRNIPTSLLPLPTSKKRRRDTLGVLDAYSFTNRQDKDINLHRLVHLATRSFLRKNGLFFDCVLRAADHINNIFPNHDHTNRKQWREYLPPMLCCFLSEKDFMDKRNNYISSMDRAANCLQSDGRWYEAEMLYMDVLKMEEERSGPEHPDTLSSMANLAKKLLEPGSMG
ncbi:kinesin light chain [Penicillium malachiteum]|uniref:kinesin light chain n=1 Tax=Penicillium malachiteum TaxID=1324776 RepID=UPI00254973DB|nr:kinesin light chain [Penicillium malachiteum]KAJ5736327.1 kinesin light chain [Penicillium malachiteum]